MPMVWGKATCYDGVGYARMLKIKTWALSKKLEMDNRPAQLTGGILKPTPELDGIRGWACASVLIAHCLTGVIKVEPGSLAASFNSHTLWLFLGGVDLFFVLSGFLIGGILIDSKARAGTSLNLRDYAASFWIRRIARIFPVAYLLLATYCAALFVRNKFGIIQLDNWLLAEPRPPVASFATFTQSWWIAVGGYGGPRWMGITWSLAIEEQFYLLFPFAIYFLRRRWIVALVIAGIVAAPILRDILERLFGSWYAPYVLLPSRVDGLMFGVAVALIIRDPRTFYLARLLRRVLDVVALFILYLIVTNYLPSWWRGPSGSLYPLKQSLLALMWAIVILRIFTYEHSVFNAIWRNSILAKIGLISYGLYMYHQAINGLIHEFIFNQEPTIANVAQFAAALGVLAAAFGAAILSYVYFESPIRRYGQKLAATSKGKLIQDSPLAIGDSVAQTPSR
jgi:peptidoglycan/LPS O-acetylase OafA/YrhL